MAESEGAMAMPYLEPIRIPEHVWYEDSVHRSLCERRAGDLFRLAQKYGVSQMRIAAFTGQSQGRINDLIHGRRGNITSLDAWERIADGLNMPDRARLALGLAPKAARGEGALSGNSGISQGAHHQQPVDKLSAPNAASIPPWREISYAGRPPVPFPLGCDLFACGDAYIAAVRSFRAADRHVGGGHLYAAVVGFLNANVAPRLFGVDRGGEGRLVFTAAAALTEMAGWMAHDSGRDDAAERHFSRSLDLARIGGDRQLTAHVFASISHLKRHQGNLGDAIRLAQYGRATLSGDLRQPELEARLFAMEARALAAMRQPEQCRELLSRAERVLLAPRSAERSPWASRFDEGSLAGEAAHCLYLLGDMNEARRRAERIVELRTDEGTRSRAFGQLIVAATLVAQGEPDAACTVARQALDASRHLGSYLVVRRFLDVRQHLVKYRDSAVVADFLGRLDDALHDRPWIRRVLPGTGFMTPDVGSNGES